MKKVLGLVLCLVMMLSVMSLVACDTSSTYEIAVVTDVGQLMDKGFNQGTLLFALFFFSYQLLRIF